MTKSVEEKSLKRRHTSEHTSSQQDVAALAASDAKDNSSLAPGPARGPRHSGSRRSAGSGRSSGGRRRSAGRSTNVVSKTAARGGGSSGAADFTNDFQSLLTLKVMTAQPIAGRHQCGYFNNRHKRPRPVSSNGCSVAESTVVLCLVPGNWRFRSLGSACTAFQTGGGRRLQVPAQHLARAHALLGEADAEAAELGATLLPIGICWPIVSLVRTSWGL